MMNQKERDEQFAAHVPGVLQYHRKMLSDKVRNRLLARAIRKHVRPGMSFLDIGAGTGVWAVLAAKLGAERVVAVEIEECLIPFIYKHAQENGVADRIEIVHGRSDDVKIKGCFDVIVSELFGGDALGADTVNSFIDLRTRFLAEGGTLIPQRLVSYAAPVYVSWPEAPAGLPFSAGFLDRVNLNYPMSLPNPTGRTVEYLAEPRALVDIDFRTIETPPPLANLTASWKLADISRANAIATFNLHSFTDGVTMDSRRSRSWGTGIYSFEPFAAKKGELAISLTMDAKQANWSAWLPGKDNIRPRSYSPVFAFTRVRMAQAGTPHKSFRRKKA